MTETNPIYNKKDESKKPTLGDLRRTFTKNIIKLLTRIIDDGLNPMIGRDGDLHMRGSLHYDGLAMDIILMKDGTILTDTPSHLPYGIFWKGLDPANCWGGDFAKSDGNHYSMTYQGKR